MPKPSRATFRSVQGPAEVALNKRLLREVPKLAGLPDDAVRRSWWSPSPGDFKIDLRPLTADPRAWREFPPFVMKLDGVVDARAVGPDLFFTMSPLWLAEAVVPAVLSRPLDYGSFDIADGACLHVQFSSPNLNKALHVGHLRNNFIGNAVNNLLEAAGYTVMTIDAPANWGKHITKAVLAYDRWGDQATPESTGKKGDRFVQEFYRRFAQEAAADPRVDEVATVWNAAMEDGDLRLRELNERLTEWSYAGISETYRRIGSRFDLVLRESETTDQAKDLILSHIGNGSHRRDDGSVFVDLTDKGLRQVTVIRQDGTPLVDNQYLGLTLRRQELHPEYGLVNVMGRDYKERVPELEGVAAAMGCTESMANHRAVYHGLVKLPEGKMRSRDGSGLNADDVLDDVRDHLDKWLEPLTNASPHVRFDLADQLGVALLKFHFLRRPVIDDIVWEPSDLWDISFPRFIRLVRGFARAEAAGWRHPTDSTADPETRVLLLLNDVAITVARAVEQDDPKPVLQLLEDLAARPRGEADGRSLSQAYSIVLRRTLALLNIELPKAFELLGVL
jgi:arginyl-tRNA synthetase